MLTSAKNAISVVPLAAALDRKVPNKRSMIAIIDDDEHVREAIKGLMRPTGYLAETSPSATEFLRSAIPERISCLIADVNMPEMSGLDLYFRLTQLEIEIPTILITA